MSRYIDADVIENKLQQHHDFIVNAWGGFREMPIQDKARCDELSNSIAEILSAPSIDIVRCKDCIYNNSGWCGSQEYGTRHVENNDYCSEGERKER